MVMGRPAGTGCIHLLLALAVAAAACNSNITHRSAAQSAVKYSALSGLNRYTPCGCIFDTAAPYFGGFTHASPGALYYNFRLGTEQNRDVIYAAGNLPIILTAPHGGDLEPDDVPDRGLLCGNLNNDAYTMDLAFDIRNKIFEKTGKYPHMIISRLARIKLDANRAGDDDCNPETGRSATAWKDYHRYFIESIAIPRAIADFGRGLLVDVHGKPDNYGADVMLGYNLTATNLSETDAVLNDESEPYIEKSTIKFLYRYCGIAGNGIDFADILRGNVSGRECLGDILTTQLAAVNTRYGESYTVTPRSSLPDPTYNYSGEYTVIEYAATDHARYNNPANPGAFISGFQLETCMDIREDAARRLDYADAVAGAIIEFLNKHYQITL